MISGYLFTCLNDVYGTMFDLKRFAGILFCRAQITNKKNKEVG